MSLSNCRNVILVLELLLQGARDLAKQERVETELDEALLGIDVGHAGQLFAGSAMIAACRVSIRDAARAGDAAGAAGMSDG